MTAHQELNGVVSPVCVVLILLLLLAGPGLLAWAEDNPPPDAGEINFSKPSVLQVKRISLQRMATNGATVTVRQDQDEPVSVPVALSVSEYRITYKNHRNIQLDMPAFLISLTSLHPDIAFDWHTWSAVALDTHGERIPLDIGVVTLGENDTVVYRTGVGHISLFPIHQSQDFLESLMAFVASDKDYHDRQPYIQVGVMDVFPAWHFGVRADKIEFTLLGLSHDADKRLVVYIRDANGREGKAVRTGDDTWALVTE